LVTIFERSLVELSSLLLVLLDCSFEDTTTFVDQMPSDSGFAGVDVADDWDARE
jgi:hypothetical protein